MAQSKKKGKRSAVSAYLAKIGRRGGEKKVPKGAATLTPEQRRDRATAMSKARWDAYYKKHPDKHQAKLARDAKKAPPARARRVA